ncbi:hypothetical protein I3F58_14155 [Streptomyces sp. MUM 203J]|uniref:hypothetical protein n=1 Tax=Streptomyces sp. MUM 203J TaxID=2791990 RepID=UPI001F040B22|nr:hypothetical protein [Streptomyces sp. MUM 203J]MCH0540689.1 hypothetical protein [Streptomyces sp. MUM 203J]
MRELVRKSLRNGAVAVTALASAAALTACGSDGDGETGKGAATPSAGASAGDESGSEGVGLSDVQGSWATSPGAGGKPVVLTVSDAQAVLVAEGAVCQGAATPARNVMLQLTCNNGDAGGRTKGEIDSADGKALVVVWEGGAQDTLTKTSSGLPTGLPTGGLPTNLPTGIELPALPPTP